MSTGNLTNNPQTGWLPLVPARPARELSETEFVAWANALDEGLVAEWVDGDVVMMSPVNREHARIAFWFLRLLAEHVDRHQLGEVFGGELAIRFEKQRRRRVPDGFFVAAEHLGRLKETYLDGAPDLVLEVVSPDSHERDWREKHREYESIGVREYWVIDPQIQRVELNILDDAGAYQQVQLADGWLVSQAAPGFCIRVDWLWNKPRPTIQNALTAMGK